MEISFDNSRPIYKQIVSHVLQQIKEGVLKPGDRLPTERELAERLGLARGTVKKAYKELADNNIIEVRQGSGSYVYSERDSYDMEYRRLALLKIDELISKLEEWNFSGKEIAALFRMSMAKKDHAGLGVRVAVIDCNAETLAQFKRQLAYIPGVTLSLIMVDSVLLDDSPGQFFQDYDLVLTTATHYEEVSRSLKGIGSRLLPVGMAPSRQTIVALSTLPEHVSVGVICRSNKFSYLVNEQLELFRPGRKSLPVHFETDVAGDLRFMRRFGAVICAPDLLVFDPELSKGAVEEYQAGGGRIIPFEYHIDRASLLHVEESIDGILRSKQTE